MKFYFLKRQPRFFFFFESYQELKEDYLSLVITIIDIVDGAAYLFDKEMSSDRKNWKAELELEQYRSILQMEKESN